MTMRDIKNNIDVQPSLNPAAKTATSSSTGVDLQFYNGALVVVQFGAWTDGTHTPVLEESDTLGSGYTTVAAGDALGALTAVSSGAGQNAIQVIGYRGKKRYVRVTTTVSGATSGAVYGVAVIRGLKRHKGGATV